MYELSLNRKLRYLCRDLLFVIVDSAIKECFLETRYGAEQHGDRDRVRCSPRAVSEKIKMTDVVSGDYM